MCHSVCRWSGRGNADHPLELASTALIKKAVFKGGCLIGRAALIFAGGKGEQAGYGKKSSEHHMSPLCDGVSVKRSRILLKKRLMTLRHSFVTGA